MTISKEAIEAAHAEINKSWRNERWEWDAPKSVAERALSAALPFLPIAVEGKVKALEWRNGYRDWQVKIQTASSGPFYQVRELDGVVWLDADNTQTIYPSVDAAKAAAQTDYETRILSALISSPGKEGWQLVPVKMTADMINAWSGGVTVTSDAVAYQTSFQDAWKRVLIAAPSSPGKDGGTENTPRTDRETMEKGCPNDPNNDPENKNIGKDGGQEVEAEEWQGRYWIEDENRWSNWITNPVGYPWAYDLQEGKSEIRYLYPQPASTALVERLERERDYAVRWANKAVADVKEHDCNRIAELEAVLSSVEDVIFGSTIRVGSPEYFGVRKLIRDALSASTSREGER